MDKVIYDKIEEIFCDYKDMADVNTLKEKVTFNCKKSYNQLLQSGFSAYIAVTENLDYLTKIQELIKDEHDLAKVNEIISSSEKILSENIKNTVAETVIDDNYDKQSLDKIKELVGEAAVAGEELQNIDIVEQNDEIIYKTIDKKEEQSQNTDFDKKQTENNRKKSFISGKIKSKKAKYIYDLVSFLLIVGLTAVVIVLLHHFNVF